MKKDFNLDECAKALSTLTHFKNTNKTSRTPGKFNEVLTQVHATGVFTPKELADLGITTEILNKAFAGKPTGISQDNRTSFLFSAEEKLNIVLGLPVAPSAKAAAPKPTQTAAAAAAAAEIGAP